MSIESRLFCTAVMRSARCFFPITFVLMDEMICEINHILNCGYEIKRSYDPRSCERNFSNFVKLPENLRLQRGLNP